MNDDFYVNDHGASEFGALLLSSWNVSGSALTQNYLTSYTGGRITFCSTQYGLRSISLPVDIYGTSPADAAAKRSALTAAFLGGTVELIQTMVAHKEHPIPSPTEEDPTRPKK